MNEDYKHTVLVIAGKDWNGSFQGDLAALKARKDINLEIIRPEKGKFFSETYANHAHDASIAILASHGDKNGFTWSDTEQVPYYELMKEVSRGVDFIQVLSCQGGAINSNTVDYEGHNPKGAVIQALVSDQSLNYGDDVKHNIYHGLKRFDRVGLMIAGLGAVDATKYAEWDKKYGLSPSAENVLPQSISIASSAQDVKINFSEEITALSAAAQQGSLDKVNFGLAVLLVKQDFNASGEIANASHLNADIDQVAQSILQGKPLETIFQKQIASALVIANLDRTGELDNRISNVIRSETPVETTNRENREADEDVADAMYNAAASHSAEDLGRLPVQLANQTQPPARTKAAAK